MENKDNRKTISTAINFGVINSPLKREDYLNFDNVYLYIKMELSMFLGRFSCMIN